jgi:hypothetical protein
MSKMDNLRAMREARYDEAAARSKGATSRKPAARPAVAPANRVKQAESAEPAEAADGADGADGAEPVDGEKNPAMHRSALCGHRAISGRVCTRQQGHTEKSHRYS